MTTIGYATLQLIPSLDGVSSAIDKQLGGTLKAVGTKGGKDFAKAVGDGMQGLQAQVDAAAKAYDRLKDKASDALGKVRADEAALNRLRESGASDDRIIRAEERLAKSRRDSARASREAEDGHRSLTAAQRALGDSTDDLGRKMGGIAGFAATAGSAMASAGVIAGGVALAGITALGGGLVEAGKKLYELGAQFDDVFDNIRVKTGATGPALQALEDSTKRVASTVPESISTIGNVVAETSRALHLTGTDLDSVAKSIATLGRLTGEEVDVRTLGKAFRGFGVDAKDQVEALDSLFRATQSTGIGVNELLATVVKGGAGLRQFGFDFGQSAALVTQFEDAGLDSEKAMVGLTKGLASMAKDGKTGQQALKDNVTQIKELIKAGNDAGALDLTNQLFGAKGGVQFFDAIKKGALDLDALSASLNSTGDTIEGAAQDTDDWAEKWATFKNKVQVALQPLASGTFDVVNEQLEKMADWVSEHQPEIIGFFADIGAVAATSFGAALKGIGLFTEGLGQMVGGLGNVIGALKDASAWEEDLFGNHDSAEQLRREAQEAYGWGKGLQDVGKGMQDAAGKVSALNPQIREYGERAQEAAKFTSALGEATAALPDGKTITISDNSPETIERLEKLGIEVIKTPNGITVTAKTEEAQRILDAFRAQQTNAPITPEVKPDLTKANAAMQAFLDQWSKAIVAPPAPAPPPPPVPSLLDPNRPPLPRADGGFVGFADGGITPSYATIQRPVGSQGLIQWAEPSTGGEAYIPLAPSKRARSLDIWAKTGELLGAFDWGGIHLDPHPDATTPKDPDDPNVPAWIRDWCKGTGEYAGLPPFTGRWTVDDSGRVITRGMPGGESRLAGSAGGRANRDLGGRAMLDSRRSLGDVLGSGSPGNTDAYLGMYTGGPNAKLAAMFGGIRKFDQGGFNGPDVVAASQLAGTAYNQAARTDCSGMVARVVDRTLGLPETGLMSTKNAADWLAARGFKPGIGGPGQISVGWYDHGPNPNDGHMAMTLSDGRNAEAGGSVGVFTIGGAAAGASSPQFDHHMFLPTVYGEGPAGRGGPGTAAGAQPAAAGGSAPPAGGATTSSGGGPSGGGGGRSLNIPSSLSGFGSFLGQQLGQLPGQLAGDQQGGGGAALGELGNLGAAAGSFIDGQVSSALSVFGVPSTPGWLKGISQLIGGISIGGGSGPGAALPIAANQQPATAVGDVVNRAGPGFSVNESGNMNGNNGNQAPGVTYNITARDTEDAFIKAQRLEKEKAAAKLSRF